ncbi:MAG: RNA polymerase sigma factor [Gemmataceae bacterium]
MPPDLTRQMIAAVLRHGSRDGPTDRELLARFAAERSEDAFAELVRRHGSVVLSVCRRVTGHVQDAEDAFQAAFMVLARRAGHIAKPELLGNWLYGVAYRTALEARNARRRVKEQPAVSAMREPAAAPEPDDTAELRSVIDEELAKLPEKYRAAVVLCDLEGLGRKEAAGRLRVPEGTLSSRLAHARKVLAGRLSRRGLTASAAAISTALGRDAVAVPHQLVSFTARAAARSFSGGLLTPDVLSPRVSTLTDGVMKAMIATRLKLMTGAGMVALTLLGLGSAAVIGQSQPAQTLRAVVVVNDDDDSAIAPAAPKPKDAVPPKTFTAKGIADDDVPYAAVPGQAVVRYEDNKLVVRQRTRSVVGVRTDVKGMQIASYEIRSTVTGKSSDCADVAVFDMKGNRVADKVWKEKLKADQHVLLATEGKLPHPRELTLFKDDTLVIVLPSHTVEYAVPAPSADAFRRSGGGALYEVVPGAEWPKPAVPPTPALAPSFPAGATNVTRPAK